MVKGDLLIDALPSKARSFSGCATPSCMFSSYSGCR